MKIGAYDPRDWPRTGTAAPRPAAEKVMTEKTPAPDDDEATISEAARKLAADNGPGGPESAKPVDPGHGSDFYDRPEIRSEIARRIADEMLTASPARKEDGKDHDSDDNRERGS